MIRCIRSWICESRLRWNWSLLNLRHSICHKPKKALINIFHHHQDWQRIGTKYSHISRFATRHQWVHQPVQSCSHYCSSSRGRLTVFSEVRRALAKKCAIYLPLSSTARMYDTVSTIWPDNFGKSVDPHFQWSSLSRGQRKNWFSPL